MDRRYLIVIPVLCLAFLGLAAFNWTHYPHVDPEGICVQPRKLVPGPKYHSADHFFKPKYLNHSAELLGGAIRIPTQSFDDMGSVGGDGSEADPRYAPFRELHKYLAKTFPKATKAGNMEYVNELGLLYTFKGNIAAHVLKPALLMAHLDVVPVNKDTLDQWTHEPFSGYFDGEWIYGRGSGDTKNTVVGILEAIEALLDQNWAPSRTILVAFGFDEEIGGARGSGHLSQKILNRYGPNSLEFILDEGFGNAFDGGLRLACPLVTERGYMDVRFEVDAPGGHSSSPPPHTSIGMLSDLIVELEDNAFAPGIKDYKTHPAAALAQCVAKYSPDFSDSRRDRFFNLKSRDNLDEVVEYITSKGGATQFMVRTSQAVDIMDGGVKINALPEQAVAWANYRTSIDSSPREVYGHIEQIASKLASQYGLGLHSNGSTLTTGSRGNLTLYISREIGAAPIAPKDGKQWDMIAGTMKHVFEDLNPRKDTPLVISPSMMTGSTDTRHYWALSKHIYRYSPVDADDMLNYHTINERLRARSHASTVAFFYELLQHAG